MKVVQYPLPWVSSKYSRSIVLGSSRELVQPDGMAWTLDEEKNDTTEWNKCLVANQTFSKFLKCIRIHTRAPFFHDGRAQLEFPALKTDLLLWQNMNRGNITLSWWWKNYTMPVLRHPLTSMIDWMLTSSLKYTNPYLGKHRTTLKHIDPQSNAKYGVEENKA